MNHIYHSVWNESSGVWITVPQINKRQGKRSVKRGKKPTTANSAGWVAALSQANQCQAIGLLKRWQPNLYYLPLATGLLLYSSTGWALPTGEQLVAGHVSVSTPTAGQMQIDQTSQKAVVNWQGFSVNQHEALNIHQPNANAALLNRVVGQDASQIQGKINANGQVYITNPNGVVFTKSAQVDVGGLVATTHNIKDADFMAGKNHFTQDGAQGTVDNHGTINTQNGGVVALIGEKVTNTGTINTPKGTTALAAGKTVDLDFKGDGLVEVKVSEAALNAQITNKGAIQADGGRVVLTAKAAGQLIDTVINQEGVIRAQGMVERNGEIILEGGTVSQTGIMDASGNTGGKIDINARAIVDAGKTNADGTAGNGGTITMKASDAIIQTAAADTHANGTAQGGTVHLEAANSVYSSGKIAATGQQGGTINVVSSDRVVLAAADVDASGGKKGGVIRVGGDFHGATTKLSNKAKTTIVNSATKLKANGGAGKVVVWSEQKTDYYGSISANKAGEIEVSSKGTLTYAGAADAGVGGKLLLDPKNIIIAANAGVANYELIDPHLAAGNLFGANTAVLGTTAGGVLTENGNIAVTSSGDSLAASHSGAVYLFNSTTGALLSALIGSSANDQVGLNGITALTNGNYVISSSSWNNGTASSAGAVTWANGLTGLSGVVSSANSLVGSSVNDYLGSGNGVGNIGGITALTNGNYVVSGRNWDNGAVENAGAATWGSGVTGISGTINAANSLVGTHANDIVSSNGIVALTNGNYVVASSNWSSGTDFLHEGAATWGNGATGIKGAINAANSLVGTVANDNIGSSGITALTNGNYVVGSSDWSGSYTASYLGAATWGNGASGVSGVVSATNSLVGSRSNDHISREGITALTNGNYVVASSNWSVNAGQNHEGAVTWGNGTTGVKGLLSAANSLIGSSSGDNVGSNGVTALTNGNYVVGSSNWSVNSNHDHEGAATWGNGATGMTGTLNAGNSLIGVFANDGIGEAIVALTNGNYVVASDHWNSNKGAATWGNGSTGITGTVSSANSLVGSTDDDGVASKDYQGRIGVTALTNGNYVVASRYWDNGIITDVGAATWGNGVTGIRGFINATNSFIGADYGDGVGSDGITALSNGNYVVGSSEWHGGADFGFGAATWGNGSTGSAGVVGSSNSLVGSNAGDYVSFYSGITALANGNYVVGSNGWKNGTVSNAGAATWGNGVTGSSGAISTLNSLTGSVSYDLDGEGGYKVTPLSNGNYVLQSGIWDNGNLVDAGRVLIGTPQNITFNNGVGQIMTFNPSNIANTLAAGTNITLQASNDITLNAGTDINVAGSTGGKLTMQAGRNINLNASIRTANGDFTAVAGDPNALAADRDAGTPTLTLGSGATINAGSGKVILAAVGGNFVNNTGSATPITASQWLVYSTDPSLNTPNGLTAANKHYAQIYTAGVTPGYATSGNWFLYSVTPVLTVTPSSQTIAEGMTPDSFIPTDITGFIDGDTNSTAGISGTGVFGIDNFTGAAGSYNVSYLSGLVSTLGYAFTDNINAVDELTVTPALFVPPPDVPAAPPASVFPVASAPSATPLLLPLFASSTLPLSVTQATLHVEYAQLTPLQVSTTFLHGYHDRFTNDDNYIDYDFGQYKADPYLTQLITYEARRHYGKRYWHEKKHHHKHKHYHKHKHKSKYTHLLLDINNGGIKLPAGWMPVRGQPHL